MALDKQSVNIPFALGLDLKTDPWQLNIGNFLSLQNITFNKGKRLQKRNGFKKLGSLPSDSDANTLTTFKGNLTAIGNQLFSYSDPNMTWEEKGRIQPVSLQTQSLVRGAYSQSAPDSAVTESGLVCTTFLDGSGSYKYQISDSTNGEVLIPATSLESGALLSRVFILPGHFVITYLVSVTGTPTLRYVAVPLTNLSNPTNPIDLSTQVESTSAGYDGIVANDTLYIAWSGSDMGGAIRVSYLDRTLTQHATVAKAGHSASLMSVTADESGSTPTIWVTAYSSMDAYSYAFTQGLVTILDATHTITSTTVNEITSVATDGVLTLFYQVDNNYTYDTNIASDFLDTVTCTVAGVVGTPSTILRSVGLASKAFYINGITYMLAAYGGAFQPTYFLIDEDGNIVSKFAYSNGGGYPTTQILPSPTVIGNRAQIAYRFKSLLLPVNKSQNAASIAGVYSQTGINLATFNLASENIVTSEIGLNLNIAGGIVWAYDGVQPVEQGFNVWPEDLETTNINYGGSLIPQTYYYAATYEWTDGQGNLHRSAPSVPLQTVLTNYSNKTWTNANVNTGANTITITGHGYVTGVQITATTGGTLPSPLVVSTPYYIIKVDANTIKLATSYANALAGTEIDLTTAGAGTSTAVPTINSFTNTIYVPTLRLTYKVSNPVRIVLYRWSTAQQTFYQISSITSPTLNSITTDYITYIDTASDASIVGNSILYTTGGVLENIAPPGTSLMTLFKNRLFLVDAEDGNLLWYSKQVIEAVPVEMSDLLTLYVAPSAGAQGDTGVITALAPLDDKLILFKRDGIYYITGTGPDNTGANNDFSDAVFITAVVGCVNQKSIVFTPKGLIFESDKGKWLLGRDLSTSYIGAPVEDFNGQSVTGAVNIPATNQVRFMLEANTSCTLYQNKHTILNQDGMVLQEDEGHYLDEGRAGILLMYDYYYEQWGTFLVRGGPVLIGITTAWMNLTGLQGFERAYFFYILGEFLTPHRLNVSVAYDYNPSPLQNVIITPDNYSLPYGTTYPYGTQSPYGGSATPEQFRIFMKRQKCQAFQINIQEAPSSIVSSGAGLTLSGLNLITGIKGNYPRIKATKQVGLK